MWAVGEEARVPGHLDEYGAFSETENTEEECADGRTKSLLLLSLRCL